MIAGHVAAMSSSAEAGIIIGLAYRSPSARRSL
jgi:hypothetical protein